MASSGSNLPITRVDVRVVCGNQELTVSGSKYLNEPPTPQEPMRFKSTDDLEKTVETFMNKYKGTPNQFSIVPCYGSTCIPSEKWIVTPRKPSRLRLNSVGGENKQNEAYLDAAVREFEEETGSSIPKRFFQLESPTKFCLNLDPSAKTALDTNFQNVKPATETYGWNWSSSSSSQVPRPCPSTADADTVKASDITPTAVTLAVLAVRSKPPPPSPSLSTASYSEPNAGESLNDYITRILAEKGLPSSSPEKAKIRNFGRTKGLSGGSTIRRKKSKPSKKRGTSKKGVRR